MSSPDARGTTDPSGQSASPPGADAASSPSPTPRSNTPPRMTQEQTATQGQSGHDQVSGTNQDDDQPCQSCGAPGRFQCSACKSMRYCSQECQAQDWRAHYRECAELKEGRTNGDEEQGDRPRSRPPRSREAGDSLGDEAENIRAVANQPRRRPREPRSRPRMTPEQQAAYEEAERIADMKFYMLQIYKIIKPVVVCICLSILWVKISMAGSDYRPTQSTYTVYRESPNSTVSQNIIGSLANAGIIIGQIVIVTIIIVVLFKRGHIKILIGFFMIVVAMLLGFMGYILVLNLIQVLRIPLDFLTMAFALWNFAVTGLISVFWKGPMWLQQVYLTVMSSLMAFSLTGLAEWTTWMLLALLVVWDLIAVLCPFGPLKILVESSRNQNQEVPALLYTVNAVWFMASPPNSIMDRKAQAKEELDVDVAVTNGSGSRTENNSSHSRSTGREGGFSFSSGHTSALDAPFGASGASRSSSTIALVPSTINRSAGDRDTIELRDRTPSAGSSNSPRGEGSPDPSRRAHPERSGDQDRRNNPFEDADDDDGGGLKLGLGDFVFYSVLIARAAMFDWVTTMCCTVAVLTGMNATIFLLAIYQKALPALPISIVFGMLFYFATRFALVPFIATLGPNQVFI
ncbi:Presenilin-domain-containing protein [Mortierella sp. GBAus27b]|nr:Presenilin-domain-containing protein [Mortierella sp. GBAus27b]